ncbi:MAG: creatininase family protein [Proteobacteria bacterium]|nr:creatininase family protein [Pseudomonadota bacterium]
MHRILKSTTLLLAAFACQVPLQAQDYFALDAVNPIAAGGSLWTEELTWIEVRDAVVAGMTTVIIGTGGVEQNGPFLVTGKHNYVLATVLPYIAEEIGNTLIAPVVKFVPEGDIDEKSGHMAFPGTISLQQSTFEALLTDICRSYAAHGFTDIILVGDSGGNQRGMANVAESLNESWQNDAARVHHLAEFYTEDRWSYDFLKSQGITQVDSTPPDGEPADRRTDRRNNMHDDIYYEAQTAVQNPDFIRASQRLDAGLFALHGVDLSPVSRTVELGEELARYRAGITAEAFRNSMRAVRGDN